MIFRCFSPDPSIGLAEIFALRFEFLALAQYKAIRIILHGCFSAASSDCVIRFGVSALANSCSREDSLPHAVMVGYSGGCKLHQYIRRRLVPGVDLVPVWAIAAANVYRERKQTFSLHHGPPCLFWHLALIGHSHAPKLRGRLGVRFLWA
jgi:hypothetical protein